MTAGGIAGIAAALAAAGLVVFEAIAYSPTRSTFLREGRRLLAATPTGGEFTAKDLAALPAPVRRHIEASGFLGTSHIAAAVLDHRDVSFELGGRKRPIRYTQVNAVARLARWAFIDTRLHGVPFQGVEGYLDGDGRMRGVLGKLVTLFDETGPDLDSGTLVTILAEALIFPDIALANYVTWDEIDATHAGATLRSGNVTVAGVFSFGQDGLMTTFRTEARVAVETDGTRRTLPWSVTTDDYTTDGGLKRPGLLRAIWHEPEGERVYFESRRPLFLDRLAL